MTAKHADANPSFALIRLEEDKKTEDNMNLIVHH